MNEIEKLMEGNKRFVSGKMLAKDLVKRRGELANGQQPYAIIVTCSDSRVAPEYIFDANLGELFVIRIAGNVVDNLALGSIEYAAEHLHSKFLLVMGHSKCGAVTAAYDRHKEGNVTSIVEKIMPVTEKGKKGGEKAGEVEECIKENAKCVAEEMRKKSEIIRHLEKEGKLKISCAKYYLENGKVEIF